MMTNREFSLKYFWSFQEVVESLAGGTIEPYDTNTFSSIFYSLYPNAPLWKADHSSKAHIEELWQLVYARFYREYCYGTDEDVISGENEFMIKFINLLVMSYPKYSALLDYYSAKEGELMAQINSVTTGLARFNDTPQDEENSDEFEGDLHVTNLTKTRGESATDGMSPIERLKQIQDSFKLILRDWSDEFKQIFIEGGNITL